MASAAPAAAQRAPAAPDACADFYGHANSAWLAQNPLPAGATSHSRWDQLNTLGVQQRDQVLAATTAPANATVSVRLADLFASAQDEAAIEAQGIRPIQPMLAIVDKIRRNRDVAPAIAALHAAGVPVLVGFGIKDAATARACAAFADGVIVGSALVSVLAECEGPDAAAAAARAFLAPLREAVDPA